MVEINHGREQESKEEKGVLSGAKTQKTGMVTSCPIMKFHFLVPFETSRNFRKQKRNKEIFIANITE